MYIEYFQYDKCQHFPPSTVTLTEDEECLPPLHHSPVLHSHQEAPAHGLCAGDELCQLLIPHLLQESQQPSFEEHLAKGNVAAHHCHVEQSTDMQ